ncbi:MAG: glycoside hydrolase family 43 protein [Rikenellaceae bacterium]|nr:glycoside hydrolase family 43 protein [Rikenellaceae bacterium]
MKMKKTFLLTFAALAAVNAVVAQNPIIQTQYTADPAPMVYNDRLYVYTTHDEDGSTWFTMDEWRLYSTNDMVNWTDHGAIMKYTDFEWGRSDAWAAQCIERDGKFYLYVPLISKTQGGAIGVAVGDSPYGPFYDPLGKPLARSGNGDIDPTVFIDDDGQAYLYWGNPNLYYVKLNEDMISYEGEIVSVPMTTESFGKRDGDERRATLYEEGPWIYKRNQLYYLFWPGGPLPEHIGYSTSTSPTGPWKYGGVVMPTEEGAFTNHPGVIDFRGKTYFFYHNGALPGGGGFNRSVAVEELMFNADGSIPPIKMTEGVPAIATLNPYVLNQAETIAFSEGFKSAQDDKVGVFVTANHDGSYIRVRDVDFRDKGPSKFTARVAGTHNDPVTMEVRLDGVDGQLLGSFRIPRTGGSDRWQMRTLENLPKVTGVHDLYFVVKGSPASHLMYFDYWMFSE